MKHLFILAILFSQTAQGNLSKTKLDCLGLIIKNVDQIESMLIRVSECEDRKYCRPYKYTAHQWGINGCDVDLYQIGVTASGSIFVFDMRGLFSDPKVKRVYLGEIESITQTHFDSYKIIPTVQENFEFRLFSTVSRPRKFCSKFGGFKSCYKIRDVTREFEMADTVNKLLIEFEYGVSFDDRRH